VTTDVTSNPVVETVHGSVRGSVEDGVAAFKGVPYGAVPADRRFLPPRRPDPWRGVREATAYGPSSLQLEPPPPRGPRSIRPLLDAGVPALAQQEECLVLNVWTRGPGSTPDRPVMVWFHGGAWLSGSASHPATDGASLCRRGDVVVVGVNHRLGLLGYLYLGDLLGDEYQESGTAGVRDLMAALEWVRDNIAAFGGDPDDVTILGESGGGVKVQTMLGMPAAAGLFHRAVIESGSASHWLARDEGAGLAEVVLRHLGLKRGRAAELRRLPGERLLEAQAALYAANPPSPALSGTWSDPALAIMPVVNGLDLPQRPDRAVAAGSSASVPVLVGSNEDEATLFLADDAEGETLRFSSLRGRLGRALGNRAEAVIDAYRRTRPGATPWQLLVAIASGVEHRRVTLLAERRERSGAAATYVYRFAWATPVSDGFFGSPHALEIPFVFDNVDAMPLTGDGPERHRVAERVSEAWIAFARTGNPSHPDLPPWPAYAVPVRCTMVLGLECEVVRDLQAEERRAWGGLEERILR
jgi:para-nitrobenzyl esterase